jgi:CelD/BcsL family acetyltransferase involved in cellulose biosynthesis
LGESEFAAWHGFQQAGGMESPFLSPEFACDVDMVSKCARVAVVHDGGDLVGFLPFEQGLMRTARGIGGGMANCQAFVCSPRAEVSIGEVLRGAGVNLLSFHALLPTSNGAQWASIRPVDGLTIDLSHGFDDYLAATRRRSGHFIKEIERKRRRLDREHPGIVGFEFGTGAASAVVSLVRWKSAQYRRTGRPDPFARRPARELLERLVSRHESALTGCVSVLSVAGQPVAVDLSLRSATALAGWFTGYDVAMSSWSPGGVATLDLIEGASQAGVKTLELGTGDERFKRRLANSSIELQSGWIGRPSVGLVFNRAAHAPSEWAQRTILARPRLREFTRQALVHYGTLRTGVARGRGAAGGEGAPASG